MALIKIYSLALNKEFVRNNLTQSLRLIGSAVLNCPEIPTTPSSIEVIYCEGIDLAGIDYIIEIVACKRPNLQKISDNLISALNAVYPKILFSVYFNLIEEAGMTSSPRIKSTEKAISTEEAIDIAKSKSEKI